MKLPISKAERWINCPGSPRLEALYPRDPNEYNEQAELGKAADWLAEHMIAGMQGKHDEIITGTIVGQLTPNNVVIDQEMFESCREYVNDVFRYCNETGTLRQVECQRRVDMSWYNPDQFGYIDAVVHDVERRQIVIWDLKYGHNLVEVFENWQLIGYAKSLIDEFGINGHDDQSYTVVMKIVQPRGYHVDGTVRQWVVNASELRAHVNRIKSGADDARKHDAMCTPAPRQCSNCRGRHACEALQRAVYQFTDYCSTPMPVHLDAAALSVELRNLRDGQKLVKARVSGLETQAITEMTNGVQVPGFATAQGYGREKWKDGGDSLDEVVMLGDMMGIDVRKEREIDTPAQLRKKGIDDDVIKKYSFTPKTSVKLVEDDGSKARRVFSK